jgi:hypothetical protein
MVIVYPDNIFGPGNLQNQLKENSVHLFIGLPKFFLKNRVLNQVVKERPDRFIAKTIVVQVEIILVQENGKEGVFSQPCSDKVFFF